MVANKIILIDQTTAHILIMELIILLVINLCKEMTDLDISQLAMNQIIFSKLI